MAVYRVYGTKKIELYVDIEAKNKDEALEVANGCLDSSVCCETPLDDVLFELAEEANYDPDFVIHNGKLILAEELK